MATGHWRGLRVRAGQGCPGIRRRTHLGASSNPLPFAADLGAYLAGSPPRPTWAGALFLCITFLAYAVCPRGRSEYCKVNHDTHTRPWQIRVRILKVRQRRNAPRPSPACLVLLLNVVSGTVLLQTEMDATGRQFEPLPRPMTRLARQSAVGVRVSQLLGLLRIEAHSIPTHSIPRAIQKIIGPAARSSC